MTIHTKWPEVMEGLRGLRLWIYDDLMEGRAVELRDPKIQNIVGWLAYHQFLARGEDGTMRARPVPEARERWMAEGAARDAAAVAAAPQTAPADQGPETKDDGLPAASTHARRAYTQELFP